MKKKIHNLHRGFSVAELLMTMLVVMVIAVALVPIIGPKKVKLPVRHQNHGIFECYAEVENGSVKVKQYSVENGAVTSSVQENDYCDFTNVPIATSYDIYVVGAGAAGPQEGSINKNKMSFNFQNVSQDDVEENLKGDIRSEYMFEDINDAQVKLNKYLNFMDILSEIYEGTTGSPKGFNFKFEQVASPIGSAGQSIGQLIENPSEKCTKMRKNNPGEYKKKFEDYGSVTDGYGQYTNADLWQNFAKNDTCYTYTVQRGGDSGKRLISNSLKLKLDTNFKLNLPEYLANDRVESGNYPNTNVKIKPKETRSFTISTSVNNQSVTLEQSKSGYPADLPMSNTDETSEQNKKTHCNKNSSSGSLRNICNNNFYVDDTSEGYNRTVLPDENCSDKADAVCKPSVYETQGLLEFKKYAFSYYYRKLQEVVKYYPGGTPGNVAKLTVSVLRGPLRLTPAKSNTSSKLQDISDLSKVETLLEVKPQASSNPSIETSTQDVVITHLPSPNDEVIENTNVNVSLQTYIDAINTAGYRGGLYGCNKPSNNKLASCPGYAGPGFYPIADVSKLRGNDPKAPMLTIKGHAIQNITKDKKILYTNVENIPAVCPNGNSPQNNVCKAANEEQRHYGAIIILW